MRQLEVFFDYTCPFCVTGHENLLSLLPDSPEIEVLWRPCEAHPRPERYGLHSDLCIQGMFFAAEHGADLFAYHERLYSLCRHGGINIEDADVLAAHVGDLLDPGAFREALRNGHCREAGERANMYAYEKSGVWAVPAYRMGGRRLDSVENVGVTKAQLKAFLEAS